MKNILIIATFFPPMGGVGTVRAAKYVKYLRSFGWNPTVVTIADKYITNYDDTLLKDINKDIKIIKLELKEGYKKIGEAFYNALKKQIDTIIQNNKFDAFFITGGPFEPMRIAPYIFKKYKIQYIIDLRDPWKLEKIITTTKLKEIKAKIKRFLIGIYEKKIFKYAFKICTVNETMNQQYQEEYKKIRDKFVNIPNGYDPEDYEMIEPKKLQGFNIVYAGKFEVSSGFRNPTSFFKAIKIVNDNGVLVNFIHVGQQEERVIEIAKKEQIEQYCTFVGRKSYRESLEYCKGANILLVIGGNEKCEQTGKIFDYIGCAKPIIVLANADSEITTVCKSVENAYCIEKNNIDKIVKTIVKIHNEKNDLNPNKMSEKYMRNNLTLELVKILDQIEKGSK